VSCSRDSSSGDTWSAGSPSLPPRAGHGIVSRLQPLQSPRRAADATVAKAAPAPGPGGMLFARALSGVISHRQELGR
jgi:hypothetical protein